MSGDVSFNEDDNVIAIDNTVDGFDLHAFDNGAYVRTLPTTRTESRLPRQVAFAENGHVVVGGGNDGMIYVFDRRSGVTLDTLCHEPHVKGSQTLTVSFLFCCRYLTDDVCARHSIVMGYFI